jgi:hypothetical protein
VQSLSNENLCFTLKVIFPAENLKNVVWSYDLDSAVITSGSTKLFSNYVETKTIVPPAGAFNTGINNNGGYGDNVGTGKMSFYPAASISTGNSGYGWGIDMGIPVVYRLAYNPDEGMLSEFDLAISKETKKFPGRSYFKLLLFQFNPEWNLRAALDVYYRFQPEYFKRRVTQEGIWLPFAPLYKIKDWKDFGFGFHETNWNSEDEGLGIHKSSVEAGKLANVLTFQYTEPWEEEIPITKNDSTYEQVTGNQTITEKNAEYFLTSASLDKNNKYIARKLETPWFTSGWSVSINTNTDPDIEGFNRYNYLRGTDIDPALKMNIDGIYFDCLEWNWQYDLNYNTKHFKYTDFPLTFSSSLEKPRPVIWCYSTDYKFIRKIAEEMHEQGKYVMGNTFYWIPFSAGVLDLFGSELSWYDKIDTKLDRLEYLRAMAYQKPAVFLLNVGLSDKAFTKAPYDGYKTYFEKMLFYGFFPSFFSEDASNNIYWADSGKYNQGRPFFKKYIPLIKEIALAGWQPVSFAKTDNKSVKLERFGSIDDSSIYFTLYNTTTNTISTTVTLYTDNLKINRNVNIEELIDGEKLDFIKNEDMVKINLSINGNSARLIKLIKK